MGKYMSETPIEQIMRNINSVKEAIEPTSSGAEGGVASGTGTVSGGLKGLGDKIKAIKSELDRRLEGLSEKTQRRDNELGEEIREERRLRDNQIVRLIGEEKRKREEADANLDSALKGKISEGDEGVTGAFTIADQTLEGALKSEISKEREERIKSDESLNEKITAQSNALAGEVTDAESAVAEAAQAIDKERAEREQEDFAIDRKLTANLINEARIREEVDKAEKEEREQEDFAIDRKLESEAKARERGDNSLKEGTRKAFDSLKSQLRIIGQPEVMGETPASGWSKGLKDEIVRAKEDIKSGDQDVVRKFTAADDEIRQNIVDEVVGIQEDLEKEASARQKADGEVRKAFATADTNLQTL